MLNGRGHLAHWGYDTGVVSATHASVRPFLATEASVRPVNAHGHPAEDAVAAVALAVSAYGSAESAVAIYELILGRLIIWNEID